MAAKKQKLSFAFDLLKTWHGADGCYIMTSDTWHALITRVDSSRNKTQRELMIYVLDQNAKNYIGQSSIINSL